MCVKSGFIVTCVLNRAWWWQPCLEKYIHWHIITFRAVTSNKSKDKVHSLDSTLALKKCFIIMVTKICTSLYLVWLYNFYKATMWLGHYQTHERYLRNNENYYSLTQHIALSIIVRRCKREINEK